MGMWNITINGCGAHHNEDYEKDANKMAAKFVEELRAAGHIVDYAAFTYGGCDVVRDATSPRTPDTAEPEDPPPTGE